MATSSTEAEYMALALAAKHYLWFTRGIAEFGYTNLRHAISCDNKGADDLVHNPRIGDRSKHIQIAYHFTREQVDEGTIVVIRIPGDKNLADICTKTLVGPLFNFCRKIIM